MDDRPSPVPQARILVVDDDAPTRAAIARVLNAKDYQADEAASGSQALVRLAASPYDLLLLDLHMPGMDGVEVMKRVQEAYPDLAVIVLTAHGTLESAMVAVKAGAVDYLLKPSPIQDIEAAIARALQHRRERLRRQHLIHAITEALEVLRTEERQELSALAERTEQFLQCGPVTLDSEKRLAVVMESDEAGGRHAELTVSEAALLAHLMQYPDTVFSYRDLARNVLSYHVSEREAQSIIRPHISRLRKKVEPDPDHPRLIRNIRGKGYLFSPH